MGYVTKTSDMARRALEAIAKHPGLTPIELHSYIKEYGIKATSMSALTSALIRLKKVHRVKVPMTSTYRYYPRDHPLPEGVEQWDDRLIQKQMQQQSLPLPVSEPPKRRDSMSIEEGGVLITIQWGSNRSETVSVEAAREIYARLRQLFGG